MKSVNYVLYNKMSKYWSVSYSDGSSAISDTLGGLPNDAIEFMKKACPVWKGLQVISFYAKENKHGKKNSRNEKN